MILTCICCEKSYIFSIYLFLSEKSNEYGYIYQLNYSVLKWLFLILFVVKKTDISSRRIASAFFYFLSNDIKMKTHKHWRLPFRSQWKMSILVV